MEMLMIQILEDNTDEAEFDALYGHLTPLQAKSLMESRKVEAVIELAYNQAREFYDNL